RCSGCADRRGRWPGRACRAPSSGIAQPSGGRHGRVAVVTPLDIRSGTRAHNWRLVQVDSVFIGIVTASGTFLPVFLLRLGASANDVGLLTALPALTAFALAIPFGRWLQGRRNIVPWYSRMRL